MKRLFMIKQAGLMSLLLMLFLVSPALQAKEAQPMAADPVLEKRMLALSEELRCLVCQNQALSGSDSDFAKDVRREMRTMMKDGRSDQEVVDFLVARYGDFILFNPPMKGITYLLWYGPLLLLSIGLVVLLLSLRRRRKIADEQPPLSSADHQRASELLAKAQQRENEGSNT